jgi:hypothetical protein
MSSRRRLPHISFLIGVVFIAAVLVAVFVLPALSQNLASPTIDVSWNDWNQAKAKWDALQVDEYEETVEYSRKNAFYSADTNGTWTLRVISGTVQLISEQHTGVALTTDELASLTVDGLFSMIASDLEAQERGGVETMGGLDDRFYREVAFEPALGYPLSYHLGPKSRIQMLLGQETSIRITNLDISHSK